MCSSRRSRLRLFQERTKDGVKSLKKCVNKRGLPLQEGPERSIRIDFYKYGAKEEAMSDTFIVICCLFV